MQRRVLDAYVVVRKCSHHGFGFLHDVSALCWAQEAVVQECSRLPRYQLHPAKAHKMIANQLSRQPVFACRAAAALSKLGVRHRQHAKIRTRPAQKHSGPAAQDMHNLKALK